MSPVRVAIVSYVAGVIAVFSMGCHKKSPEEQMTEARTTFQTVCARCHGAEGHGGPAAAPGAQAPRNFVDATFHKDRTDAQLLTVIKQGKSPGMPSFGGTFDEDQVKALVQVVRSFDPARAK